MTENDVQEDKVFQCGYISIVGRPNVGKSTLINRILGQKISITSRKPQTTRHRILGIKTSNEVQAIYVDTPGILSKKSSAGKAMHRYMAKEISVAMVDVDVIIFVIDRLIWMEDDEKMLKHLKYCHQPIIMAVNKVDQINEKKDLMPWLDQLSRKMNFAHIVPLSALKGHNVDRLERLVNDFLPRKNACFPEDEITDRSSSFLATEIVREKIMRQMGEEIPYQVTVDIEKFVQEDELITISALIMVEKNGQKKMIIGEKGQRLKNIGQEARYDMEKLFNSHVMLNLWVKVRSGWSDDELVLRSLGYH